MDRLLRAARTLSRAFTSSFSLRIVMLAKIRTVVSVTSVYALIAMHTHLPDKFNAHQNAPMNEMERHRHALFLITVFNLGSSKALCTVVSSSCL